MIEYSRFSKQGVCGVCYILLLVLNLRGVNVMTKYGRDIFFGTPCNSNTHGEFKSVRVMVGSNREYIILEEILPRGVKTLFEL